jgi:hypothetical protein
VVLLEKRSEESWIGTKNLSRRVGESPLLHPPGSSTPAWVLDWRARRELLVDPLMVNQSATNFLGNLRPPQLFVCLSMLSGVWT